MAKKVFYLTKSKLNELRQEYEELLELERQKTVGQEAPKILESEDMNPEFVSFQEDMSYLRQRLDELKSVFENHQLIKKPPKSQRSTVGIGANVRVDISGKNEKFVIVGTLEADPSLGKISNESPVGRALLGLKIGEKAKIGFPTPKNVTVKAIKYEIS